MAAAIFLITGYHGATVWHLCVRGAVFYLNCLRVCNSANILNRGNLLGVYTSDAYHRRLHVSYVRRRLCIMVWSYN